MGLFYVRIVLLFFAYSKQEITEPNITYHQELLIWKNAANFCFEHGGVLVSNTTILNQQSANGEKTVWVGKYTTWTPWHIFWGCYQVQSALEFNDIDNDILECQKKCVMMEYTYFAVKGSKCLCISETSLASKITDYTPCNCCSCAQVMRNEYDLDTADKSHDNSPNRRCLSAACIDNRLKHTVETNCNGEYLVVCENGKSDDNDPFKSQPDGVSYCQDVGSYLKRYTTRNICGLEDDTVQHWTSGTQSMYEFDLHQNDFISRLNPFKCTTFSTQSGKESTMIFNRTLPFFCRYDTTKDKTSNQITYNCLYQQTSESGNEGVIVAAVTATCMVIIITITFIGVFLIRKRFGKNIQNTNKETKKGETTMYNDMLENNMDQNNPRNDAYSWAVPDGCEYDDKNEDKNAYKNVNSGVYDKLNDNAKRKAVIENTKETAVYDHNVLNPEGDSQSLYDKTQWSVATHPDYHQINQMKDHDSNSINSKEQHVKNDYCKVNGSETACIDDRIVTSTFNSNGSKSIQQDENSTGYCLAKPLNEDKNDHFVINKDYDHLNKLKKYEELSDTKIYDHLSSDNGGDPTYDHSHLKTPRKGDYDTFKIKHSHT